MTQTNDDRSTTIGTITLPLPVHQNYQYIIPPELKEHLQVGCRVLVPFGHRTETGYFVGFDENASVPEEKLKPVKEVLDTSPLFTPELLELTRWVSRYYLCTWGQVLEAAVPGAVRQNREGKQQTFAILNIPVEKALDTIEEIPDHYSSRARVLREIVESKNNELPVSELVRKANCSRSPVNTLENKGILKLNKKSSSAISLYENLPEPDPRPEKLTDAQENALDQIQKTIASKTHETFLIHGVTGSGKTEIYLQAIERVVEQGRQGIVLLPEISLTPQALARFRDRFQHVAVMHSYLSPSKRRQEWKKIKSGEADVILGARSAVFAPAPNPGIIVVDEEHDTSFKQDRVPRYNARDVAVLRGSKSNCPVLLGSATPSLESIYNAQTEKYELLKLPERIGGKKRPEIKIVDMTEQSSTGAGNWSPLSETLEVAVRKTIREEGQVLLFLNRRGFASYIFCPSCREVIRCYRCELAMTYHKSRNVLVCHHCHHNKKPPSECPECNHPNLKKLGMGTERIEETIEQTFPDQNIKRMDSDSMTSLSSYENAVRNLQEGSVDILVGTQMIAKGLHFPGVQLVGIVSADTALHLSDFRSAERTFQLITQISGRTGRGEDQGTVILQSFNPDHYSIRTAVKYDYREFCNRELELRKSLGYPPYKKMLRILVRGRKEQDVEHTIDNIANEIRDLCQQQGTGILGPAPAPLSKLQNRYRYHLLLKLRDPAFARELYNEHWNLFKGGSNIDVVLDMDPQSIL